MQERVQWPDLIIASGDIVQGVPGSEVDGDGKIAAQYEEAEQFLGALAEHFVDGDRNRVILIPGNHDVDFPRVVLSLDAISEVDPELRRQLAARIRIPTSDLRWSWNDLTFYSIRDLDLYHRRLEHFALFYRRFYSGSRQYSTEPNEQVDFFDYPDFNVSIVGFSSCYNNDPFHTAGLIHPTCVARAGQEFRQSCYGGRVLLATYHHSTNGPPLQSDYMDADILQSLIDYGVRLTFHGHQHRLEVVDSRFALGGDERITMISAGTLCGGPFTLPAGQMRGYNIVEVDQLAWETRVFPRRMHNQTFATPVWGPATGPFSPDGRISAPLPQPRQMESNLIRQALVQGEQAIGERDYSRAVAVLTRYASTEPLARRLLLEAATRMDDDQLLISAFFPPVSISEAIYVADALWAERELGKLRELLSLPLVAESNEPAARELRSKFSGRI